MKKLWYLSAAGVLFAVTACQNEDLTSGTEKTVSVTASLDGQTSRTGIDDTGLGTAANRCVLQIYEADGTTRYGNQVVATVTDKKAKFDNIRLISGKNYKFVFWADKSDGNKGSKYYNTESLSNITYKDHITNLNNDELDAFTGSIPDVNLDGVQSYSVTLTRPFAQLNLLDKGLKELPDESEYPSKIKVTYANIYTAFDAVKDEPTLPFSEHTYTAEIINAKGQDKENANYFAMSYLFAKKKDQSGSLVNFKTQFLGADGTTTIGSEKSVSAVPLYRNWRTNVTSDYLTNTGSVDVTIDPGFTSIIPIYTDSKQLIDGGSFKVEMPQDKIDLSDIQGNLEGDVYLALNADVKEITLGTARELVNPKHITISVANGVKYPKITIPEGAKYLQNVTITGDRTSSEGLEGFDSGTLTNIENLAFDNVKFVNKGVNLGDGVQDIKKLDVKNCAATNLSAAFVRVVAKNYADNVTVEGNTITFAKGVESKDGRIDGVNIWYMNRGTLTVRNNVQTGGKCLVSSIPANWEKGTPDKIIVENNKVINNFDGAITIQYPNKDIEIKNNYVKSSYSAIVFMFFKTDLNPNILISGNTFDPNNDNGRYIMIPFGYNTQWGGNDEGAAAKMIIKDNVRRVTTTHPVTWNGWMMQNGGAGDKKTNKVSFNNGSDVEHPYKK